TDKVYIRRLDIVTVDSHSFVIVLVTNAGIVHNKLVKLQASISDEDIAALNVALNQSFTGLSLSQISNELLSSLFAIPHGTSALLSQVAAFITEIADLQKGQNVYLGGASRLLNYPEYHDVEKAQRTLDYISDRRNLSGIKLPEGPEAVKIIIGPENGAEPLNAASVIYTTYKLGEGVQGVIGIIGPTRMDYSKIEARLKFFSGGLNKLLSELFINDTDQKQE
ncbi:MAG: HrcA family transcriptional regulator, partial [Bacillota bacterium]|nr:HrcA family transcriptional regulator [Bacillota bacterium]